MLFDRACKAHSGLVCVATWKCRRITSESSSVLRMACRRMTLQVFTLSTPSLVSRSSQAASIAEPQTPTVEWYLAVVQVVPFLCDAHQIHSSQVGEHIWYLSRGLCPVSSLGTSQPPYYQSGCSKAPFLESIGLVYSRKAHILAFTLEANPSGQTLRNACIFRLMRSSASPFSIVQCNNVISFPTSERPSCVLVIRPMYVRICLIFHSSCLTALCDMGKVHMREPS